LTFSGWTVVVGVPHRFFPGPLSPSVKCSLDDDDVIPYNARSVSMNTRAHTLRCAFPSFPFLTLEKTNAASLSRHLNVQIRKHCWHPRENVLLVISDAVRKNINICMRSYFLWLFFCSPPIQLFASAKARIDIASFFLCG
jgi:hypothetical protein